ncbi:MAG: hypothetical protein WBV82_20950 [Myxococcaceae bacterium]
MGISGDIYRGNVCVARFWHDYRGDENGIVFADGRAEDDPVGGPLPLTLSEAAIRYLRRKLGLVT